MKKIIHVQLLPLLSGVQRVSLEELIRLNSNEFEKYLICKEDGPLTNELKNFDVNSFYVKEFKREISFLDDCRSLFKLIRTIKNIGNVDILHTHSSKTGILGRIAGRICNVPLIIHTVHGFPFDSTKNRLLIKIYKMIEKIGGFFCDYIICLHEQDKNIAINVLKINPKKVKVIGNGVDTCKFFPVDKNEKNNIRIKLELPENDFIYVMTGRLWEQKNPLLLVETAIELLQTHKNMHFIFIGDGPYLHEMQRLIIDSQLETKFSYVGWKNNVSEYLQASDVFVLPSLWEGMPLAILEALSTGIPVVASDISGNSDIIKGSESGLLFESNNKEQLYNCLLKLHSEPLLVNKMGLKARELALSKYSIKTRMIEIRKLYQNIN